MIRLSKSVLEEAKIMASDILKDPGKNLIKLKKNKGMAVGRTENELIGAFPFELEGNKFFVGILMKSLCI